jgi:hypothetical protein
MSSLSCLLAQQDMDIISFWISKKSNKWHEDYLSRIFVLSGIIVLLRKQTMQNSVWHCEKYFRCTWMNTSAVVGQNCEKKLRRTWKKSLQLLVEASNRLFDWNNLMTLHEIERLYYGLVFSKQEKVIYENSVFLEEKQNNIISNQTVGGPYFYKIWELYMIVFCPVNNRLCLEEQLWQYVVNCKGIHKFCS